MWQIRKGAEIEGRTISIEAAAGQVLNRHDLKLGEDALKKSYIEADAERLLDESMAAVIESMDYLSKRTVK